MRRASALLAAVVALALAGCVVAPPPIPDRGAAIGLSGHLVLIDLPPTAEVGDPMTQVVCATSSASVSIGDQDRGHIVAMTTTADASCPDEEALNGRVPTWGPGDALPADAVPVDVAGAVEAHRFAFEYTECTNSCSTMTREVLLAVLDDDVAVMLLTRRVDAATFDRWVESVAIV
ncbi:hypothetical protein [Agrococcus jejuensis]|uniref:Uncharacterized protein n=1 Tax=Agrococcus jejuensis TaxID=399736 RepID=A0A1G8AG73_9MICO|nr:hypothetical protein [Agrococcus jejuensis]SDH19836.1 hypothetical protein SAMN04489720_0366 [Agrococcus jejuensis]